MPIISFAWTTVALLAHKKTVTRRDWSDRTYLMWLKAWEENRLIQPAWDQAPFVKGAKKIGDIKLTCSPYRERLGDMPESDVPLEGGLWATKKDYIEYMGGDRNKVLTVVRFELLADISTEMRVEQQYEIWLKESIDRSCR